MSARELVELGTEDMREASLGTCIQHEGMLAKDR